MGIKVNFPLGHDRPSATKVTELWIVTDATNTSYL